MAPSDGTTRSIVISTATANHIGIAHSLSANTSCVSAPVRKPITASQALDWGLVNRLAPAQELPDQAAAWAAELAETVSISGRIAEAARNGLNVMQVRNEELRAHLANLEGTVDTLATT